MSEQAPKQQGEYTPLTVEALEHEIPAHASPERANAEARTAPAEQLNEVRNEVAEITEAAPAPTRNLEASPAPMQTLPVSSELRSLTAARALSSIRHSLPAADKALSHVIHQPVVRAVSNVGAKTIARPSALLTGGVLAFVGSSLYLYLASHIGLTYNYVIAGLLFAGGFVLGILGEGLLGLVARARR